MQARSNHLYELLESDVDIFIDADLMSRLRSNPSHKRNEVFGETDSNSVIMYYEYMRGILGNVSETMVRRLVLHFLYEGR